MAEWLEGYLKGFKGTLIMVTHDRYFLDSVCNRIAEIDKGSIYSYQENYSGYLNLKQERMDMAVAGGTEAAVHPSQGDRLDAAGRKGKVYQAESPYQTL